MGFSGMDVGEVERLADRLELQAKMVYGVVAIVDAAVSGLMGIWHGADLEHFAGTWHQSHRPRTQTMADQLSGWVATLRAQAQEQDHASGGTGSGPTDGGTGGFAPGSVPWIDGLLGVGGSILAGLGGDGLSPGQKVAHEISDLLGDAASVAQGSAELKLWNEIGDIFPNSEFKAIAEESAIPNATLRTAGRVLGVVGIGMSAVSAYEDFSHGDYVRGGLDTAAAGFGVAAMVTPPPVDIVCGAVAVGINLGEIAADHQKEITEFADDVGKGAVDVAKNTGAAISAAWHSLF